MIDKRRKGTFKITMDLIEDSTKWVKHIMGRMIIVRAECLYYDDVIEYIAISSEFDKLEKGEVIPTYTLEVITKMNGNESVVDKINFKRVK